MKSIKHLFTVLVGLVFVFSSCTYSLKLGGAIIPATMKTIRVDFFENDAAFVVNTLSQQFTEALKDRIRSTTSLDIVRTGGDGSMSGAITDYSVTPVSISATPNNVAPIAGASQLTITVKVKFVCDADKKLNFDESFTKSLPFKGDLASQEQNLILQINKQLTEDIFNKAFANW